MCGKSEVAELVYCSEKLVGELKNGRCALYWERNMKLKIIVHPAQEGGFWAEVPALQGCATQGNTMEELLANLHDAVGACLSVDLETIEISENDKVLELVLWNLFQENTSRGFLNIKAGIWYA